METLIETIIKTNLEQFYKKVDLKIEEFLIEKYNKIPSKKEIKEKGEVLITYRPQTLYDFELIFKWENEVIFKAKFEIINSFKLEI